MSEPTLLLHACCAPCSGAILEWLMGQGVRPVLFYSNSNIWPRAEYDTRRDELASYARRLGLQMVDDVYDHDDWLARVAAGLEAEPERGARCSRCFAYRLRRAAAYAAANGCGCLATTLASSRWKNIDQINRAGLSAVEPCGGAVSFDARNWRRGGLQQRRSEILRREAFYNQTYCGCEFSLRQT